MRDARRMCDSLPMGSAGRRAGSAGRAAVDLFGDLFEAFDAADEVGDVVEMDGVLDDGAGGGDAGAFGGVGIGGDLMEGEEGLRRDLEGGAEEGFDPLGLGAAQLGEELAVFEVAADGAEGDAELEGDIGGREAAGEEVHGLLTADAGCGASERGHGLIPLDTIGQYEHSFLSVCDARSPSVNARLTTGWGRRSGQSRPMMRYEAAVLILASDRLR